jgi:hypothetical protein
MAVHRLPPCRHVRRPTRSHEAVRSWTAEDVCRGIEMVPVCSYSVSQKVIHAETVFAIGRALRRSGSSMGAGYEAAPRTSCRRHDGETAVDWKFQLAPPRLSLQSYPPG